MTYLKVLLTVIAGLLGVLALRPTAVRAQVEAPHIYVEPGIVSLRKPDGSAQGEGKIMIDLRTGDIFGFPTSNLAPYPMDPLNQKPAVAKAVYLGTFDLDSMKRRP